MADLDYGELRLFPGNYDEYMIAATASRDTLLANNARKKDKIAELQTFVSRFSANASKAKQATSRQKQIDKLILDEVKPSSRINPYIKFEPGRKLHRQALEVIKLTGGYNKDEPLFSGTNFLIDAGERIAIVGASGIGKTALVRTLIQDLPLLGGTVKWAENAKIGYLAQDHGDTFEADVSLSDWMTQWARPEDDEQVIRGILGRMLFSGDTIKKSVTKTSGGEKMRLLLGKLILTKPNVLMLDEPTNHLDMESIESLNNALEAFEGTLFFASHDRELIASVATQIIEIKPGGKVTHYRGNYEDYIKTTSS
jgi:ATPase subunit of ABC transporter with duplicated ATPase domains